MLKSLEDLAVRLFETPGVVRVAEPPEEGFRLHIHRYLPPGAPLAPVYFETGKLSQAMIDEITFRFETLAVGNLLSFDEVAGVPHAGTPIARSLSKRIRTKMVPLKKEDLIGKRELLKDTLGHGHPLIPAGSKVLVVENAITHGDSVCEAVATMLLRGHRVSDILTIFDWGAGAQQKFQKPFFPNQVVIRALFRVDDLVEFYHKHKKRLVSAKVKRAR